MRFYVAQTTFAGADEPTKRYFADETRAQAWIDKQGNGEVYADYDANIHTIPYEGCTGDDVRYWNEV